MSTLVGTISSPAPDNINNSNINPDMEKAEPKKKKTSGDEDEAEKMNKNDNVADDVGSDDDDDDDGEDGDGAKFKSEKELDLGPQFSLKEQLEKDNDDESLKRWKEQLLGSVNISSIGESKEPEVHMLSLSILCHRRPDLVLPIPFVPNPKGVLFSLKEGSKYRLKFSFNVSNNIVSGLKYTNTVWKTGVKVDNTKVMLGTFSPQQEPYTYELEEETTPSGMFARGSYSARTKFVDDDGKCYLDVSYYFEIQKNWPAIS